MKTVITAIVVLILTTVSIPTHKAALAGGLGGGATLGMQITQQAELATSAIQNTLTAANTGLTAAATTQNFVKENLLDGIGWAIAKQMVSNMTKSLVDWINSGFEGSPAFITDLNTFLLDALDTVAGEYIKGLGAVGEFICSPFKLDIQTALTQSYDLARSGLPSGGTLTDAQCTISDIGDNIEGFFAGTSGGGWGEWLNVTSNPQNVPYGAYLEAQNRFNIKLRNEAGQEIEVANWGDGFLSKKICEAVEGASGGSYGQTTGSAEVGPDIKIRNSGNCTISTPGQVISEALTFQLSTGPRTLIEADEINEVIGALLNQLTLKAMQGINGLLGLSGGTGYTDYTDLDGNVINKPFIDKANDEAVVIAVGKYKALMEESLALEREHERLASSTLRSASKRLDVVATGQIAIDNLFSAGNSGADLINVTKNDTLATASTSLARQLANSTGARREELLAVQNKLDQVYASLELIKGMSNSANLGADLTQATFAKLETEGTAIVNELASLVDNLNVAVPKITTNIDTLTKLINRYENAPDQATASTTVTNKVDYTKTIREEVVLDYVDLVQTGKLSTQVEIERNRERWQKKLEIK